MSGFVLLHRDLIGHSQFRSKDDEYAAIWLIAKAAWEATTARVNGKAVTLERGQCCYAISFLAKAWECSKATAHARLKHFERNSFIRTEVRTGLTVITLCKYSEYQTIANAGRTDTQTTPERTPNAPRTNKKERNPYNEGNKDIDVDHAHGEAGIGQALSRADIATAFEEFWQAYPRKIGKAAAAKKFESLVKKRVAPVDELITGAMRYGAATTNTEPQFICHPTTWLNQGRWSDDLGAMASRGADNARTTTSDVMDRLARMHAAALARENE